MINVARLSRGAHPSYAPLSRSASAAHLRSGAEQAEQVL
jgi:hypothetical protein